jgi:uncharacterized membrane protein YkvA (DUF1232 family)
MRRGATVEARESIRFSERRPFTLESSSRWDWKWNPKESYRDEGSFKRLRKPAERKTNRGLSESILLVSNEALSRGPWQGGWSDFSQDAQIALQRRYMMEINSLRNSRWMDEAQAPEGEAKVRAEFSSWVDKVKNSDLVDKAYQLWRYLNSPECSIADKILIVAALLYLISPLDAVPDFIPVVGWLDDIGVAAVVLAFLNGKAVEISDRV